MRRTVLDETEALVCAGYPVLETEGAWCWWFSRRVAQYERVFGLGIPFPLMGLHMGLFPMGFTMWFTIVVVFNGPSS